MPIICVSSSKNKLGKTTIVSGIAHESINRGNKTFVGTVTEGNIVHNEDFYNIYNPSYKKIELKNSEIILIELNDLSIDETKKFLEKNDARIILVESSIADVESTSQIFGERLLGFILNGIWKYQKNTITQNIADNKILGIIEESRSLMAHTSKDITDFLETDNIIGDKFLDKEIENFLIGGFVLDWGPEYFSTLENVALVVRGDRPDVQLSAIQSGTVNLIIATESKTPVEYVRNEAKKFDIPIAIVNDGTMETIEKLSEIIKSFKFDTMGKIEFSNYVLTENLNFDSLFEIISMPITK
jgi:BioD-like phosphotransacetylase family protein